MEHSLIKKITFSSILFSLIPSFIFAVELVNPLNATSVEAIIERVVNFIYWLGIYLTPLMVIIGGFYFLTSAGDPKRIETAKKIILYAIIGFVIILLSKGIIFTLKQIIGG